jgi:hypothetical protein
MPTDTLSVALTPVEDPNPSRYGYAGDNNRNTAVFNGVQQVNYNLMEYLLKRVEELFGVPILISGVNAGTDKFTTPSAHGLSAGTVVRFKALNGGSLPGGVDDEAAHWYLLADTSTTFKVSIESGGAVQDITDAGTGDIYVYAVPNVLEQLMTSSGAGVEGGLSSIFVNVGGTQSVTGPKTLTDLTISSTGVVKLASRALTRAVVTTWTNDTDARAGAGYTTLEGGTAEDWSCDLDLPHGQVLTGYRVSINPTNVGSLPMDMPSITCSAYSLTTGAAVVAAGTSFTDDSADATIYSAQHDLVISGLSHTIDRSANGYRMTIRGSSGTNPANNIIAYAVRPVVTVTSMKQWA